MTACARTVQKEEDGGLVNVSDELREEEDIEDRGGTRKRGGRTIDSLCSRPYCHILDIELYGLSLPPRGGLWKTEMLLRFRKEELARCAAGREGRGIYCWFRR